MENFSEMEQALLNTDRLIDDETKDMWIRAMNSMETEELAEFIITAVAACAFRMLGTKPGTESREVTRETFLRVVRTLEQGIKEEFNGK